MTGSAHSLKTFALPTRHWNWIAQLADEGWAVVHDLVPADLTHALASEAKAKHQADLLERAGIGRVDLYTLDSSIRRDKTQWFDRETPAQRAYLDLMETVRLEINRALYLGLFSYESHFAAYEPKGFYTRHLDAFQGARNRVLSTVYYLNSDWQSEDGGELAIYPANDENAPALALIPPEAGSFVIFLSEDMPHEVLPTRRDRYSIAGWFRVNDRMTAPGLQAPSGIVSDF